MILGWASAWAAPVLAPDPDPLARCAADAEEVGGSLPDPADPIAPTDRIAVVIGVPCHRTDAVPSLAYATRDAVRMGEALEAGGFTVVPLLTVVDKAEIGAALDRARAALRPNGTLVVYFSGHGVLREAGGRIARYLVLSDTDLGSIDRTGLAVRDLDFRVSAIPAAHRVIVQDTCFASRNGEGRVGSLGSDVPGSKGIGALESPVKLQDGDLRLYASRFFEQAVESPELRASVYTAHLLDALTAPPGADLDGDGCVGLLEAHAWSAEHTEAERAGFQVPEILARRPQNLILGCAPGRPTRAVVVPPSGDGSEVQILDPSGHAVDGAAMPPGRYAVEVAAPVDDGHQVALEPVLRHRFALAAGDWLDLDAELERREPIAALELGVGWLAPSRHSTGGPLALGVAGWGSPRDQGSGRLVVGAALRTGAGKLPGDLRYQEFEATGLLAWTVTPSLHLGDARVGVGPGVEGGGLWRVVSDPADRSEGSVGSLLEPQLRGWVAGNRIAGTVAVGVRTVPIVGRGLAAFDVAPTLRIGVGPKL